MSYPAESQLLSYRRTGEGLEMDKTDTYSQSRTLSANRGPVGSERTAYYPDPALRSEDDDGSPEHTTLLTPRDRPIVVVEHGHNLPEVAIAKLENETHRGAPADRFALVYIILLIHGFGTLLPWNALISSFEYWNYKLTNVTGPNQTVPVVVDPTVMSVNTFMSTMLVSNQLPNVLLNGFNLFATFGGSLNVRILAGISVLILVMVETLILSLFDSFSWVHTFIVITLISVAILGTANGIYQNSVYGLAASLPPKYTNAIIIGNNSCGILVALLAIMSTAVYGNEKHKSATLFYGCAVAVLVVAFGTYFLLPKLRFYRHYFTKSPTPVSSTKSPRVGFAARVRELLVVFRQIRLQLWNVFFTFFVTLSVFPRIMFSVDSSYPKDGSAYLAYFHLVATNLNFNFFAFVGNLLPFMCTQPGPKRVWIPVALRVLFIPFFIFCNFQGHEKVRLADPWFTHDAIYIIGGVCLAVTSGYFSSITMMFASSKLKDPKLAPIAGQLAGFFLVSGIFSGLLFGSYVLPHFILYPGNATATTTTTPVTELPPLAMQLFSTTVSVLTNSTLPSV